MDESVSEVTFKDKTAMQPLIGFAIIIALVAFGFYLSTLKDILPLHLFAGILLGYILTRARFGFAGGIKRIYMRGEGSLSKALLLLLFVTSIVIMGIQWAAASNGAIPAYLATDGQAIIPGTTNVYFTNIATVFGGFIFGVGMMLAGGCGSGTLADFGEGSGRAMIAFVFFVIGAAPGHYARQVIDKTAVGKIGFQIHLPQIMGYFGALLLTAVLLGLLYWGVLAYENMRKQQGTYLDPKGDYEDFELPLKDVKEPGFFNSKVYHKLFIERWSFTFGALALAIMAIFVLVTTGKNWGVSTALVTWHVAFLDMLGIQLPAEYFQSHIDKVQAGLLNDGGTIRNIGLIVGSALSFLLAKRFAFDFKMSKKDMFYFALGGLLLGFGSRVGLGCNIGAMYAAISSFSASGWVFLLSMSLGGIVGMKLFVGQVSILPVPIHKK